MKRFVMTLVVSLVMFFAVSTTAHAEEGISESYGSLVIAAPSVEEPAQEEPTPEPEPAPAVEEPVVEPQPEVVEPTPEPTPAPVVEETQPETTPDPTPVETSNDDNHDEEPAPSTTEVVDVPVETPVVVVTPVVQEEAPVVETTQVATKKATVKTVAPVETEVLGVNRVIKTVPEDTDDIADVDSGKDVGYRLPAWMLPFLFAILAAFIGFAIYMLLASRRYAVEIITPDYEDGAISEKTETKKFFSVEKACEFIRDYLHDETDSLYTLNLINLFREEEDEEVTEKNLVYYVNQNRTEEHINYASDSEVDAIERILNFVEDTVADNTEMA